MANHPVPKKEIDSEMVLNTLKTKGVSVRKFAEDMGYSDRQIRQFLKTGMIPEWLYPSFKFTLGNISPRITKRKKEATHG